MGIVLFFVSCGYFVWMGGKPFHIAALFVGIKVISEFSSGISFSLITGAVILYAFTAINYALVDYFSDSVFIPLIILFTSALILISYIVL